MSRAWKGGSSRRWRAQRAAVLESNAYEHAGACRLNVGNHCPKHYRPCPGVCTGMAEQVHHAKGKRAGDTMADLVPACAACNGHVGDPARYNPQPRPRSKW